MEIQTNTIMTNESLEMTSSFSLNDSSMIVSYILPYPNERSRIAFFKMASINYFMQIQTWVIVTNGSYDLSVKHLGMSPNVTS